MTIAFKVPNMVCSACATTMPVKIETQQPETLVKQAIIAAGYTVT